MSLTDYVAQKLPHTMIWINQIIKRAQDIAEKLDIQITTSISSDFSEGKVTTLRKPA
jgi:hypothetical protein